MALSLTNVNEFASLEDILPLNIPDWSHQYEEVTREVGTSWMQPWITGHLVWSWVLWFSLQKDLSIYLEYVWGTSIVQHLHSYFTTIQDD